MQALKQTLGLDPQKNYLFDLNQWSVLDIIGEPARDFLQGQISCDVREVNENTMRQGVLCNLKGRILALIDVLEHQGLKLVLPHNMLESTQNVLGKSAALSRVKICPSTQYDIFGFYLQNQADLTPLDTKINNERCMVTSLEHGCAYSRGGDLFILMIDKTKSHLITTPFIEKKQWQDESCWHALSLAAGQFEIYPETRGLLLPHRLGLHETGHFSFDKGCYKGQEIIARTHYRATLKHSFKIIQTETSASLQRGMPLFNTDQTTEIGELIDFCRLNDKQVILAASLLNNSPNVFLPQ